MKESSPHSHGPERSVRPLADYRDVYELLDENVRLRPLMWVRGGSLQELMTLLCGYGVALEVHSVPEEFTLSPGGPFCMWLFEEFGWGTAFGWAAAIENNLSEGETAMDAFFRLLDQYRAVVAAQRSVPGSGKCGRT